MIYVRTCAYNAEKTLKRAIESILSQTHQEFLYYILDNGSTDGTGEIIRRYAEKDDRIVAFYSEKNYARTENFEFWNLVNALSEKDQICFLDADDAYDHAFLEEMLCFLTKNELDIAMCGSVFMEEDTWIPCGDRVLSRDLVIKDDVAFGNYFPEIYWNLRAMWGKLYTAKARILYSGPGERPDWYPPYGGDTVNVFGSVALSERIGILAKPLHYYMVKQGTASYRWYEGREKSDPLLFEKGEELLVKKCGRVSPENYRMLFAVYFHAVSDTFRVLFGSNQTAEKKLSIAKDIIFHPITQRMFTMQFNVPNKERIDFFVYVVVKLLSLWKETEALHDAYIDFEEIFANINSDFSKLLTEESFAWYMEHHPVIMRNVVLREYEYAVNNLIVYLNKEDGSVSVDYPYVLGQQLAALREDESKYVYLSKQLIRWCIRNGQKERAESELKDWVRLLPEDEEIKNLQKLFDAKR